MMASTIISWGLTLCLVGAAIYLYKPDLVNQFTSQGQVSAPITAEPSSKPPSKKPKTKKATGNTQPGNEKSESASESQGNKKRKIVSASGNKTATASTPEGKQQQPPQDEEAGLSDKDFARQFAQAQSGTKLQSSGKQQPTKKERRASKLATASSPEPSELSAEASSTTGRDADDDLTPADSPSARAFDGSVSKAGDISDMLEPAAAKPNTLRLTDVSNDSKSKKPANKAFETVLSKKKRNEKQRKEEQKLAREESDRLHEAKKQEQLRRARMAAGTSNQTKANNFTSTANAWKSGASDAVKTTPPTHTEPLLDTFDSTSSTAGPAQGAVHTQSAEASSANDLKARVGDNVAAAMTASAKREGLSTAKRQEYASEVSEEDQMQMLKDQEQEDAWESVTNKKSKKKGNQDNDLTSGASSPVRAAAAPAKTQVNGSKANGVPKKAETVNRFESFQDKIGSGLQDAEWEA